MITEELLYKKITMEWQRDYDKKLKIFQKNILIQKLLSRIIGLFKRK